jgi:hypothetical protein
VWGDMASRCGKHTELSANPHTRVTRCPCGAVHVHLLKTGVSVQMSLEAFRAASAALMNAVDRLEDVEEAEPVVN